MIGVLPSPPSLQYHIIGNSQYVKFYIVLIVELLKLPPLPTSLISYFIQNNSKPKIITVSANMGIVVWCLL